MMCARKEGNLKKFLLAALLAAALAATVSPSASPAGVDTHGPPCANITSGDIGYSEAAGGDRIVNADLTLAASPCTFVTYTFFVYDTTGTTLLAQSSAYESCLSGSSTCIHYTIDLGPTAPQTVCVVAVTSIHGHIADVAPDARCNSPVSQVTLSGVGGQSGFG